MEYKIEVTRKVVDDRYTNVYEWKIMDENGKVKLTGEGTSWLNSLEEAKKKMKRLR